MAGITLERAEQQLQLWLDADAVVSTGQSYTIASRTFTRTNAKEITDKIVYWESKIRALKNGMKIRSTVINL